MNDASVEIKNAKTMFVLVSMNNASVEINNAETRTTKVLMNDASVEINNAETMLVLASMNHASVEERIGKLLSVGDDSLAYVKLSYQIVGEIVADGGRCITTLKPVLPY
jgi:hypothetical protein